MNKPSRRHRIRFAVAVLLATVAAAVVSATSHVASHSTADLLPPSYADQ